MMPGSMAVACDRFAMSEMAFEQDGLRHTKCEPFVIVAGVLAGKYEISIDGDDIVVGPGQWYVSNSYAHRIIVHRRANSGPMRARWFKVRYVDAHLSDALSPRELARATFCVSTASANVVESGRASTAATRASNASLLLSFPVARSKSHCLKRSVRVSCLTSGNPRKLLVNGPV